MPYQCSMLRTPSRTASSASYSWIFMSVAMGSSSARASLAMASQTSGRAMNTLSPTAPRRARSRTDARASAGVSPRGVAYGMMVGAAIRLSRERRACAATVSIPSPEPGSRMVVMPCASQSLYT